MSGALLTVLRICLLLLVYLVMIRVLRILWLQTRPVPVGRSAPDTRRASRPPGVAPARLVVVAPVERAGRAWDLPGDEITLGRSPGCTVVIDDPRVSKVHARLVRRDGRWWIEDLGSTNGTRLDGRTLDGPTPLTPGGRIEVGGTMLELR